MLLLTNRAFIYIVILLNSKNFRQNKKKARTNLKSAGVGFFCVFKIISWYIIVEKARHQKKDQY